MKPRRVIIAAGLVCGLLGLGLQVYAYMTEVPSGFQRVDFVKQISQASIVSDNANKIRVIPSLQALNGKRIFVKGRMYPQPMMGGLDDFFLITQEKARELCPVLRMNDFIKVKMTNGLTANYTDDLISVAGVFRIRDTDQLRSSEHAFELEAASVGPSKTFY